MFSIQPVGFEKKIVYTAVRDGKKLSSVKVEWSDSKSDNTEMGEGPLTLFGPSIYKCATESDKSNGKYYMTVPCFDRKCFLKLKKDGTVTPKIGITEKSGKFFMATLTGIEAHITTVPPSLSKLDIYGTCSINGVQRKVHEEYLVTEEMLKSVDFSVIVF